jgi:transposase
MDLGDRKSFLVELAEDRQIRERAKIPTTRQAIEEHFSDRDPVRVVLEASTHSRWIESLLKRLGHEVLVVDPRRLPRNPHEDKSDWKDAEHLARVGQAMPELLYPVVHRDDQTHGDLQILKARDALVRCRTQLINTIRGFVKSFGSRLPKCSTEAFVNKAANMIPPQLHEQCAPLVEQIRSVTAQIKAMGKQIRALARHRYPESALLTQVDGVGEITALSLMLTIGDKHRFAKSRDVGSYFGLRPKLHDSSSLEPQLSITKAGDEATRRYLVNAAHYILGPLCKNDSDLKRWGENYIRHGGKNAKKRAVIAMARKLAVLLHRLWVTGEVYEPLRGSQRRSASKVA